MQWVIKEQEAGRSIREFLQGEQQFSRRILKTIIYEGGTIRVNGLEKTLRYFLQVGDHLEVTFPREKRGTFLVPEPVPLSIVYEDNAILVIDKQAGVATIPSKHHPNNTIANGILHYYDQMNIANTVHVVTRLDRDTSGLVLIAKNQYSHSILSKLQKQNGIKRSYKAIVEGKLKPRQGTIKLPIGRKEESIIERMVREDGQPAITHYHVWKYNQSHSIVDIELETGRTHQIRVHFSYLGHPLAGDELYGGSTNHIKRQALHCSQLIFRHPFSQELVTFPSPLPTDMKKWIPQ